MGPSDRGSKTDAVGLRTTVDHYGAETVAQTDIPAWCRLLIDDGWAWGSGLGAFVLERFAVVEG